MNSQFVKKSLLSQPLGYYYEYITNCVLCILAPQLLNILKIKLKFPNLVFLNK